MASLVKIGHIFLNLDRVLSIEDLYAPTKQDKVTTPSPGGDGFSGDACGNPLR